MWNKIDKREKQILLIASIVSAGHLFLVAYAAIFLHISVPTCQPNEKIYDKAELRSLGEHRYEAHYLAKMWIFEPRKLVIPVGSTVDFFLVSQDVNHGFHIDETDINLMAVPGVVNKGTHTFNKPGLYHVVCHEYCGFGHQNMNAEIEVSSTAQIASIDQDMSNGVAEVYLSPVAMSGKKLYQEKGCVGCHSVDGSARVGPSFKGLYGRTEEMTTGLKVIADDSYMAESIKEPLAKIVKGFAPAMPKLGLSDDDIKAVTEYIKTLK